MAKVTSKRQITIPKAIADRYQIREGDHLAFIAAGEAIRLLPAGSRTEERPLADRLALFDAATKRQLSRQRRSASRRSKPKDRGWTREELHTRGRSG